MLLYTVFAVPNTQVYGATRALVETLTRFKLMEQNHGNVVLRSQSVATGFTFNQDKSAVTGNQYINRAADWVPQYSEQGG